MIGEVITARRENLGVVRGIVTSVSPEIETSTRIVIAEARLRLGPDNHPSLRTGATVRVSWDGPKPRTRVHE